MRKFWGGVLIAMMSATQLVGCAASAPVDYCTLLEDCVLFSEGLLAVEQDDKWGYVNTKNEVVIDFNFDGAAAFINGTAVVKVAEKYNLIDKKGKKLLTADVDGMTRDYAQKLIIHKVNNQYGWINESGKVVKEPTYASYSGSFSEGLLAVRVGDKWGFVNTKGQVKVEATYDSVRMFTQGLSVVKQNSLYGYIDTKNTVKIDIKYASAQPFDAHGRAIVTTSTGDYQLIDTKGDVVISGEYIKGSGPIYGVLDANDIYKLYDKDGDRFTTTDYTDMWSIGKDHANVEINATDDMNQLYDEDGTLIHSAPYDESDIYEDDFGNSILVTIDMEDEEIMIYGYDEVLTFEGTDLNQINKEIAIVRRNDRYGAIDYDGRTKVEFYYDDMFLFENKYYMVEVNGKYGVVDKTGKTILPMQYDLVNPLGMPR